MLINHFIQINSKKIKKESIEFTKKTRLWCKLPYPNHPNGCSNYNKNPLCPPNTKYMKKILIDYQYYYLIYAKFDLKRQRERMLSLHPHWSNKQANCLLYWQNSVKKELKESIKKIIFDNKNIEIFLFSCGSGFIINNFYQKKIYSMEAAGINVYNTLKNNNIDFELKPKNKVILATLLCSKKELSLE